MSESDVNGLGVAALMPEGQAGEMPVAPAELVRRADGLLKQGEPTQAEPLYRQALARDPGQLRAYQQLATITLGRGDIEGALALLASGLERKPTNTALIHAQSKALRQAGRFGEALETMRPLMEQVPPVESAYIQAAEIERLSGNLESARTLLFTLGPAVRGVAAEMIRLARALRDAGRLPEAIALMREAHVAVPGEMGVLNLYAELLGKAGAASDPEEFERVLALRLDAEPGHGRTLLALAARRIAQERREEAFALLRQASEANPTDPHPYLRRAALVHEQDVGAALNALDEGLSHLPMSEPLAREKARILSSLGRDGEAEAALRPLLAESGGELRGSAVLRLDMIAAIRRQGRLDEARDLLGTAFASSAEVREGLRLVGDLRINGRTADALAVVQHLLAAQPRDTSVLLALAGILQRKEAFREAQAVVEQVLKIDPTLGRAYAMLADIQGRMTSAAAAMSTLELGFVLAPPTAELYTMAATLLFNRGEDGPAWTRLREGLEHFPTHRGLLRAAIDQSTVAGRFGDLNPLLAALPDTAEQRSTRHVLRARAALARLQYEEADSELTQAEREAPDNRLVWVHQMLAAMPRLRMEEAKRAQAHLRRLVRDDPHFAQLERQLAFYSEVFNDLLTDPAATVVGREAVARNDLNLLCAAVRDFPDSTGLAIALVVSLRRSGRLPGPTPRRSAVASPIPRLIHQFWDSPEPPEDVQAFIESWSALNPSWTCRLYHIETAQEMLAESMPAPVVQAFQAARHSAHKADIFRLAVLLREGGVYADIDDRCTGPLDPLCAGASLVLWHENLGSIGNNFIACRPGHPLIGRALLGAVKATLEGHSEAIWLSTGPGLLTRTFAQLYATDTTMRTELEGQTRLLPDFVLRSFVACGLKAVYKSTEKHWVQQQFGNRSAAGGRTRPEDGTQAAAPAPQPADT